MKSYALIKNNKHILWLLVLLLIVIDQIIKIEVKTNMCLYESIKITDWFYINFIENNGMAFGMTFINKVILTLFRLVASVVIAYYLYKQIIQNKRWIFVVSIALILAGALGNIVDCLFYGLCFTDSTPAHVSSITVFGEGYAPLFKGKVVDMFYFPIIDTYLPDWIPFVGGDHFVFFHPVFNFADSCVSIGFIIILLFCRTELANLTNSNHIIENK